MQDIVPVLVRFLMYPLLALLIMYVAKSLDDARTPFKEDAEITGKQNLAIALRKGGIYLGLALGLSGAMWGTSGSMLQDVLAFIKTGAVMIAALFVAFLVNDRVILRKVDNDKAVAAGNTALGLVELASYVGSGIIMHGSFSGEGGGLLAAAVFFLLGQAALVCAFFLYELLTPRCIGDEIEQKGNTAEAIDVAGMLIAFALILRASIAGPFTGWIAGIQGFALYFAAGLIFLLPYRFLGNRLFARHISYDREIVHNNLAVAALSSSIQVAIALVIAGAN